MSEKILRENSWPEEYIRAVLSHGWGFVTEVKPESLLEKTLFAVDELTGLVATSALVRPSRSVMDMEARSVKKKWNDKRFAAGVDRSVIEKGAEMGAPKFMEWYCAFGLLVTLVWLYLEILKLLSKLSSRD